MGNEDIVISIVSDVPEVNINIFIDGKTYFNRLEAVDLAMVKWVRKREEVRNYLQSMSITEKAVCVSQAEIIKIKIMPCINQKML